MKHRRRGNWMCVGLAALAASIFFSGSAAHGDTAVKSTPDVVIFDGAFPGWPTIDSTPSGKLLCAWREGAQHAYSPDGKLMLGTSVDGGRTWSTPATIQDEHMVDERGAAILAISENHWLVAYDAHDPSVSSSHQTMTTYTTDGGGSWSTPVAVDSSYPVSGPRGAPIKLSTGELLLPFHRGMPDSHQPLAGISSDNGQTWTTYEVPNATDFKGNEWSVIELPNGTLAGVIRSDFPDSDGSLWLTKSTDMGRTWTTPAKTNLRDTRDLQYHSPGQIFMHNGKPWVLYDDTRCVSVALATTDDPDLLDWNIDEQIQAYQYRADGSMIPDGGYPWSVAVGDNERFIVDYRADYGLNQIIGHYVTMPTPEPGTLAMLVAAATAATAYMWRKRK